jgi:hypothetical protein
MTISTFMETVSVVGGVEHGVEAVASHLVSGFFLTKLMII